MQLMTRTPGLVKLGDVGMQADNPAIRQPLMLNVNPAVARLADLAVVRLAAVADNRLAQRLLPAGSMLYPASINFSARLSREAPTASQGAIVG